LVQQGAPGIAAHAGGGSQARRRVKLPQAHSGLCGVSTAILLFTRLASAARQCWFYDCKLRAYSLDDKRAALSASEKQGLAHASIERESTPEQPSRRVEALERAEWRGEEAPTHGAEFLCAEGGNCRHRRYDLSLNRYREVEHEEQIHTVLPILSASSGHWKRRFPAVSPSLRRCWMKNWKTASLAELEL